MVEGTRRNVPYPRPESYLFSTHLRRFVPPQNILRCFCFDYALELRNKNYSEESSKHNKEKAQRNRNTTDINTDDDFFFRQESDLPELWELAKQSP